MFTELHARSSFSFLRGASHPERMIQRAAELGYRSLALPDHMGFYGSARAHQAAKEHGLHAHVGATLELPHEIDGRKRTLQVPVLVRDHQGYQALSRLLTTLHCSPTQTQTSTQTQTQTPTQTSTSSALQPPTSSLLPKSALPLPSSELPLKLQLPTSTASSARHLVALLTPETLSNPTREELLQTAQHLLATFGHGNLYIEITRHHLRGEDRRNRLLIDLAAHLKLPLLASNTPLFATRRDRLLADAFTCLRHHTTLDQAGTLLAANPERHLKSPHEIAALFADLPEALLNTQRLAEQLEFSLTKLGYKFPSYHENGRALTPAEEAFLLRHETLRGAKSRYRKLSQKIRDHLDHELALIEKLGFSGYFLIVWEIIRFAQSQGILCQGRGSAANSAVCYCLGITAVDPIGGDLLFERFLSENRKSWPDIDIDFPSGDRREAVIQHVFQKYAPHGAAMTANVITYRPRSAFREMAKVLGFPEEIAHRFSEVHSSGSDSSTSGLPLHSSHFTECGIPADHPRCPPLLHLYQSVLTHPRHLGQHSGGMIICDTGLDAVVPLQPATMPGRTIVQWDKDDCSDLGIIKVDLLGLGMLAAMEDTLHLCAQRGRPVDLAQIPKDDPATFALLCHADTIGTFQVESRAQMATLPIMQPKTFYDVAVEVAIIRPGPIVGDLVHPYLNRRTGKETIDYIHPAFEPILARTLGIPLFQEQVLRMAMIIAGFNGAEADELRRAMSFKRSDERMASIAAKLRTRMSERHVDPLVQDKVVHAIGSFALYGFPESHAISFALIAYASCWLKAHRPAEFYCGLLNNQPMGFYSVSTLLQDAKRHDIKAKPISLLHSQDHTTVLGDQLLRLGFQGLKGLSQATIDKILEERSQHQFETLPDFLFRVRPNRKERQLLAASGALNALPDVPHRRAALWMVEKDHRDDLFREKGSVISDQLSEESARVAETPPFQTSKLPPSVPPQREANSSPPITDNSITPLPPMTEMERLTTDYALQGHSTGKHPMALLRRQLSVISDPTSSPSAPAEANSPPSDNRQPITSPYRASELHSLRHGAPITIGGLIICRQRPSTAKGHCFLSLEDETGIANLFVPRDTFQKYRLTITTERFLLCQGRIQISEGGQATIYTTHLAPLPRAIELNTSSHDFH